VFPERITNRVISEETGVILTGTLLIASGERYEKRI